MSAKRVARFEGTIVFSCRLGIGASYRPIDLEGGNDASTRDDEDGLGYCSCPELRAEIFPAGRLSPVRAVGLADRDLTAEWGEIVRTNCTIGRRELSEQRDHLPGDPRGDGWGSCSAF